MSVPTFVIFDVLNIFKTLKIKLDLKTLKNQNSGLIAGRLQNLKNKISP